MTEPSPVSAVGDPASEVEDLASLRKGDLVEARSNGVVRWSGVVDDTAPALGVVWIIESIGGSRRILDRDEYSLWRPETPLLPHR